MRRGERCTDAPSDRSLLHRPAWQRACIEGIASTAIASAVCAAAFAINVVDASSACDERRLSFCTAFNGIVCRAQPALKVDRHSSCHRPHLHSHHHRHTTMGKKKNDFEASDSGTNKVVGAPEVIN
jgi:hypothetical protein